MSNFKWCGMVFLFQHVAESQNTVKLTDRMWGRLLASMNQSSFLNCDESTGGKVCKETIDLINNVKITSI